MRKGRIGALIGTLLCVSCTPKIERQMRTWVGKPEAQLVSTWGAPDSKQDVAGATVYTWTDVWYWQGQQHTCRKTFTIRGGQVETWSYTDCSRRAI